MQITNDIFLIPILSDYLLYSPFQQVSALMNKQAADAICNALLGKQMDVLPDDLNTLLTILNNTPPQSLEQNTGALNPGFMGIVGSRSCNMNCAYCDFGAKSPVTEKVDIDKVIALIDYYAALRKNQGHDYFKIEFFGGEPFVENRIVDIVVHHARMIGFKLKIYPYFCALTNGYLQNDQRLFIKDYFDQIIVSFDGFERYHNKTRMALGDISSYQTVFDTLKYFSLHNVQFGLRCCITEESVDDMVNITKWFCTEFKPNMVNFETLTENGETIKGGLTPPDPYKFARNLVLSWLVLESHNVTPVYAPVSMNSLNASTCPVGKDTIILHPNGMIASCYLQEHEWRQKKLDLSLGYVDSQNRVVIDMDRVQSLRELVNNKPRCTDCFCKYSCAGNCHVNTTFPGSTTTYTDFCSQIRLVTACYLLHKSGMNDAMDEFLTNQEAQKLLNLQLSDKIGNYKPKVI
ncbi:MAG: radical SAM protein [Candidatus Cloacimonetes bacterium]|nr:radical SAM protein [Candidatus Cloacimonadota bacterium]